jgi:hypothetical protein
MADAEDLKSRQRMPQQSAPKESNAQNACVYEGSEDRFPVTLRTPTHPHSKPTDTTTDTRLAPSCPAQGACAWAPFGLSASHHPTTLNLFHFFLLRPRWATFGWDPPLYLARATPNAAKCAFL